jgi:hypothetical protein
MMLQYISPNYCGRSGNVCRIFLLSYLDFEDYPLSYSLFHWVIDILIPSCSICITISSYEASITHATRMFLFTERVE